MKKKRSESRGHTDSTHSKLKAQGTKYSYKKVLTNSVMIQASGKAMNGSAEDYTIQTNKND